MPESMAAAPIDLTPIDFTARAIVALSKADAPVCHIADPAPIPMIDAVRAIKPDTRVVSDGAFAALLGEAAKAGYAAETAPLIEVWNRAVRSGPARITPDWTRTTKLLAELGVAMPVSGADVRLRAYAVDFEKGAGK